MQLESGPERRPLLNPLQRRTDMQRRRFRRGVYLLPSLFTLGNLFCGYACVVYAMRGGFQLAAHRVDDAGIAAEQVTQREQARKKVNAPPEPAALHVGAPLQRVEQRPALGARFKLHEASIQLGENRLACPDPVANADEQA